MEAAGLGKRYRRATWALQDATLTIESKTITALVGPNGAGKTTLLRMWMGFERPTRGSVRVLGSDPRADQGRVLREVGFLPQQPALYDRLRVGEHLALAGHYRPGFDVAGVAERLAALGIEPERRAGELSGGQQTELALALATGSGPRVLLLDEPLASLDPLARRDFLRHLLGAVTGHDCTVVLSSHVIADLAEVCDRVLLIAVGRVLLHASVQRALVGHVVVDGDGTSIMMPGFLGAFVGLDGRTQSLCEGDEDTHRWLPGVRRATLEEIIMGRLAGTSHGPRQP